MAPPALVLDASVILKWFRSQNETNLKAAHAYRRHHLEAKIRLAVPELLYYEILNVLATKPDITLSQLSQAAQLLEQVNLDRYPLYGQLAQTTINFQREYAISLYDASYLALANYLSTNLITADTKLANKLNLPWVKLLAILISPFGILCTVPSKSLRTSKALSAS